MKHNPKSVRIDQLNIRLRNVPPELARSAAQGLPAAIVQALTAPGTESQEGIQRKEVNAPVLHVSPHTSASRLRTQISTSIAQTVKNESPKPDRFG